MRHELQPAYILHTRPYRETSLLLEAFTEHQGRIGLVARGARRTKAHLRGVLQPFQQLLLSWTGRGELGTLTGAEGQGAVLRIQGSVLTGSLYLNELLLRLLARDDPHAKLFQQYHQTLQELAGNSQDLEPPLRVFEKHLLAEIGYALQLDHEAHGGPPIQAGRLYRYELESGPVATTDLNSTNCVLHGESLLALQAERLDQPLLRREAKRLTRYALNHHLAYKPLRSRELWRASKVADKVSNND